MLPGGVDAAIGALIAVAVGIAANEHPGLVRLRVLQVPALLQLRANMARMLLGGAVRRCPLVNYEPDFVSSQSIPLEE